jgi:hypothetical protein
LYSAASFLKLAGIFLRSQEVFHERVKVYQNWQHSQLMLNKKREAKAKLDLSGKPDPGNKAAMEVVEVTNSLLLARIVLGFVFTQLPLDMHADD